MKKSVFLKKKFTRIAELILLIFLFTAAVAVFIQPARSLSVSVLSSSGYLDILDGYWIYGEVQNLERLPIQIDKATATYYDRGNNMIATQDYNNHLSVIFPSQKSPIIFRLTDPSYGPLVDHYSLELATSYVSATPLQLNIASSNSSVDSRRGGYMVVTGQVENDGTEIANSTIVYMTCYDSIGNVVYSFFDYTDPSTLPPNLSGSFSMSVNPDLTPHITSYSLVAEA